MALHTKCDLCGWESDLMGEKHECDLSEKGGNFDMSKAHSENMEFFKPEDFKEDVDKIFNSVLGYGKTSIAQTANRLLKERGIVVYGFQSNENSPWHFSENGRAEAVNTHTALLINIQPIEKPDTAESLLMDIVDNIHDHPGIKTTHFSIDPRGDWVKRAKKLLKAKSDK